MYDYIFISHYPAFYKIKQYNALTDRGVKILAVYLAHDRRGQRGSDFFAQASKFDYEFLPENKLLFYSRLIKLLIFGPRRKCLCLLGWHKVAFQLASWLSPKSRNACVVESSIYDSAVVGGVKVWLKRQFLQRMRTAYVAGTAQERLVRELGFKGMVRQVGGCGLVNYLPQPAYEPRSQVRNFLCVARLIPVKNLSMLIGVFNQLPELSLTIIGIGPLEGDLMRQAGANISFLGSVENNKMFEYYRRADVLVLPSKREAWGIVIEEALNNGTPCIVSSVVGCRDDLITEQTGLVFQTGNAEDLKAQILKITDVEVYNRLRLGCSKLDFLARANQQVEVYL